MGDHQRHNPTGDGVAGSSGDAALAISATHPVRFPIWFALMHLAHPLRRHRVRLPLADRGPRLARRVLAGLNCFVGLARSASVGMRSKPRQSRCAVPTASGDVEIAILDGRTLMGSRRYCTKLDERRPAHRLHCTRPPKTTHLGHKVRTAGSVLSYHAA